MKDLAPLVLFSYKRLETLRLTIESLKNNQLSSQTDLFIYSDAAKKSEDEIFVDRVRQYLTTITGFRTITIKYADFNKGLAKSIIDGTSEILKEHDSIIVMEDDLLVTPNFLSFMNHA